MVQSYVSKQYSKTHANKLVTTNASPALCAVVSYLRSVDQRHNDIRDATDATDATDAPVHRHFFLEMGLHPDGRRLSGLDGQYGNVPRLDRFLDAVLEVWGECPTVSALDCLRLRTVCRLHCQHLLVEVDIVSGSERGGPMLHGIHVLLPVHINCQANRIDAFRDVCQEHLHHYVCNCLPLYCSQLLLLASNSVCKILAARPADLVVSMSRLFNKHLYKTRSRCLRGRNTTTNCRIVRPRTEASLLLAHI